MRFPIFRAFHSQFILRKGSPSPDLSDSWAQVRNFAFYMTEKERHRIFSTADHM